MHFYIYFADGQTHLYIDGGVHHVQHTFGSRWAPRPILGGGEVVLGQSSRTPDTNFMFENHSAFLGEMGQVNIWGRVLDIDEVRFLTPFHFIYNMKMCTLNVIHRKDFKINITV